MSERAPTSKRIFVPNHIPWPVIAVAFGFAPLLVAFFANLWKQPEYQFFPQALAAAGFLAWERWREVQRPFVPGEQALSGILILFSLLGLTFAVLFWSPWAGAVVFFPAAVAVLWGWGGSGLLEKMTPALIMLLTIIPPPLGLDVRLGLFLRSVATVLSSRLLDLAGVIHSVDGNVIELPQRKLLVEEACSGINSVIFVTAFTVFFLLWKRRAIWYFFICLLAALAFVVMGNVVRIALGAWLMYYDGIDILTGWKHEMLSVVLVVIYVVLVMSLEHLFSRGKKEPAPAAIPPAAGGGHGLIVPRWAFVAAVPFAILGAFSTWRAYAKFTEASEPIRAANETFQRGITFSIPERIGDWSRSDTAPPAITKIETLGLSTVCWNFERPGMSAVVAFDYPIWRYHDVTDCYISTGWKPTRRELLTPEGDVPPRIHIETTKDPGAHGTLWFATISEYGEWVDKSTFKRDFATRLGLMGMPDETTFRVQVLLVGTQPLDLASREAAVELLNRAGARENQIRSLV
jgi:exosortase